MNTIAQVDIGERFFNTRDHFLYNLGGVGTLVSTLLSNAIAIAGAVFLFLVIFGGIDMIAGAGDANPERVARGKNIITAAVIGFIIIFASYWIVAIISRATGVNILQ